MQLAFTERFLRDFHSLSNPLANKCRELVSELQRIEPAALRQKALPGWRLHDLRGSNMMSLSVDMNFRVLAQLDGGMLIFHRVLKHDSADRADINRNSRSPVFAQASPKELLPNGIYDALRSFGVSEGEAEPFRECSNEDDLLRAASDVSAATANLALTLYETSSLVIPRARFRLLHKDEDFERILEAGGGAWEIYLHPSQAFLVELPATFRAAVMGSAGTGKTVCAWHRAKRLMEQGFSVGFVCPNELALAVSKSRLLAMSIDDDHSFFFVPRQPDELIQLAATVDHIVIDEGQELPVTWLVKLGEKVRDTVGVTLFYDLNQLGGNIPNGDTARYKHRISEWKVMTERFPRMQRFKLTINYRNAREIAEHYISILSDALPARPAADVPTFESGEVVEHRVSRKDLGDVLSSLLRRLSQEHASGEIGIVVLDGGPGLLLNQIAGRGLSVTEDPSQDAIAITSAATIRGHERQVMIVVTRDAQSLRRNFGVAIDAYIAMSRAVKCLIVVEVDG